MPALNFKSDFVDAIQRGEKRQTIRQIRKRPIQSGDKLALYTGMRTARCWKISDAICEDVKTITIAERDILLDGVLMSSLEQIDMAHDDGFISHTDMRLFFKHLYGLPFTGVVIRFRLTSVASAPAPGAPEHEGQGG